MIEQLEAVRLPADWDKHGTRTTETLVERMRALSDERLMAFNEDLGLLHNNADPARPTQDPDQRRTRTRAPRLDEP